MRRRDREITSFDEMLEIIAQCKVCRLALCGGDMMPYIVPLNYGYIARGDKLTLYFHSAKIGRKMDIIKENSNACFEIDCDCELLEGEAPCDYGYAFKSVIGFGRIAFAESNAEKTQGLNALMRHQTGADTGYESDYEYPDAMLARTAVYRMDVQQLSGKKKVL
ncbi:MAG: pyridoxamine 5'-phosphate oxidase family protein [Oscillospiraceae bacterium]|jgi:nitroimidazol reductase NimA-like FMN-containing flavoprotein (pyridoxamine 5'-phosphate oxidase superfamily)|nr:pyridoxamine 5'-phosphate oxidase family protein [Oscillospiraceae bacterium]